MAVIRRMVATHLMAETPTPGAVPLMVVALPMAVICLTVVILRMAAQQADTLLTEAIPHTEVVHHTEEQRTAVETTHTEEAPIHREQRVH